VRSLSLFVNRGDLFDAQRPTVGLMSVERQSESKPSEQSWKEMMNSAGFGGVQPLRPLIWRTRSLIGRFVPTGQVPDKNMHSVCHGASDVDISNEAWSHRRAEDVRIDRSIILEALLDNHHGGNRAITTVNIGYHFLTSISPVLPNDGDSTRHLRTTGTLRAIGSLPNLSSFTGVGLPTSPEIINTRVFSSRWLHFRMILSLWS
jgi:hypothetical protein